MILDDENHNIRENKQTRKISGNLDQIVLEVHTARSPELKTGQPTTRISGISRTFIFAGRLGILDRCGVGMVGALRQQVSFCARFPVGASSKISSGRRAADQIRTWRWSCSPAQANSSLLPRDRGSSSGLHSLKKRPRWLSLTTRTVEGLCGFMTYRNLLHNPPCAPSCS